MATGKEALEFTKDKATNELLQFIVSASKGYEYVNKQKLREIIDWITLASCLEGQVMINENLDKKNRG